MGYYIDDVIVRMASLSAINLVSSGVAVEDAVSRACPDAWAIYRDEVLQLVLSWEDADHGF